MTNAGPASAFKKHPRRHKCQHVLRSACDVVTCGSEGKPAMCDLREWACDCLLYTSPSPRD
eukprot:14026300-Alexandrium_andersonii.AAC.1